MLPRHHRASHKCPARIDVSAPCVRRVSCWGAPKSIPPNMSTQTHSFRTIAHRHVAATRPSLIASGGDVTFAIAFLLSAFAAITAGSTSGALASEPLSAEDQEFFEARVRPLLIKHCHECHSAASDPIEGGLRLDSRPGWQRGGDSGVAIVPGRPEKSLLIKAISYTDEDLAMPPSGALSPAEVKVLREWVHRGAPDPRTTSRSRSATGGIDWDQGRKHWAFQPIRTASPPAIRQPLRASSPIDQFVLARLDQIALTPVGRASRAALIRRLTIDLTGVPPTVHELATFLNDTSPEAWSRQVDRLLADPSYGQVWGRHWLDVVRYADDQLRTEFYYRPLPHAWRYRDWVVNALNADMPYDRFVTLQLAGDLLGSEQAPDGPVAVGFLALGMMYQDDGGTPDGVAIARAETLDDRVDTVTRGLLALTVSCARCHDHKFDPVPTADYYALAGIFNNTAYVDELALIKPSDASVLEKLSGRIASLNKQLQTAKKDDKQEEMARLSLLLNEAHHESTTRFPRVHSVKDSGDTDMRVALRGDLRKPGPVAPRGFLKILEASRRQDYRDGSGRKALAESITGRTNPLTARVIVNRLWQHHFGSGLVATASNFGAAGSPPSHPALLDWLASRLITTDWSLKQIHREILVSDTYCRSSMTTPRHLAVDPGNKFLWRMPRKRMEIESWRDAMLLVSGSLDRSLAGPPATDLLASKRRTLYTAIHRDVQTTSDKLLRLFDFPNPRISSGGRTSTTIPQQQLFSLNSPFIVARARELASRTSAGSDALEDRVTRAIRLTMNRDPSRRELQIALAYLRSDPDALSAGSSLTRWQRYCQVLLGTNEFVFRP